MDLAYDGTNFHGWAAQQGLRTVQGELETWLSRLIPGEPVRLTVAGRTDAGVHARGQVAHFDAELPPTDPEDCDLDSAAECLTRRLNRVLDSDILVRSIQPAPQGFDARFSALQRTYCFRLWDANSRPDPLLRNQVLQLPVALDTRLMDETAKTVLGLHDFVAFSKRRPGATTIRELRRFAVARLDDPTAMIAATLVADAYTHSMVRSLVGALAQVGCGHRAPEWFTGLISAATRPNDVPVLPPSGLTLERVDYPSDDQLAARAEQARAMRTEAEL
jgi:tRNA pseudouridine38-40 synthase